MIDPREARRLNRAYWDAIAEAYQRENATDLEDALRWGPGLAGEETLRALGPEGVRGKEVLELGCGGGQGAVWAARAGARRVVGVDLSPAQLAHAREHAASRGVAVEWREGTLEDLAFAPDASFDVVFSAFAMGFVPDAAKAFREAHRVLRPGGVFAFSWSSPAFERTTLTADGMLIVTRSWFDRAPFTEADDAGRTVEYPRTHGEWLALLVDAGFAVEALLEPAPEKESTWRASHPLAKTSMVPAASIWRARKPTRDNRS
ncbi:MAG TPA: class I SAM-dependent methyltransferase [Candidatus Thermoplasmatota archaeon]|nr:class I SAM-dependent methyltransferase [Candidatus Thermoplasmatota archaeon]